MIHSSRLSCGTLACCAVQAAQLNQQKSLYEAVFEQHLSAAGMCTNAITTEVNRRLFSVSTAVKHMKLHVFVTDLCVLTMHV